MNEEGQADIHFFAPHPVTGEVSTDEEGDPMLGFYFELKDLEGKPISALIGPYGTPEETESACHRAWLTGDYWL